MASRHYLFLASLAYAFPVLRPLQDAIRARGDQAAWFIDEEAARRYLQPDEKELRTVQEVLDFQPEAVFTCGNYMYDFFPGIKVQLFHGYPINKRNDARDDHFTLRGWFDIYCTQGPSSSGPFRELAQKKRYFRVYETGWTKADTYFSPAMQQRPQNDRPTILYSTTFTRSLTSTPFLADEIERLVASRDWNWVFMFHPKLDDPQILGRYEQIAARHPHVTFLGNTFDAQAMQRADVMLCDSSSVILEFMFLDKPVVTFRNSHPDDTLLDIQSPSELEDALEQALTRPEKLMRQIHDYTLYHEPHRDCRCSERVLEAVDDFRSTGSVGLKSKPLNLVRRWKIRRKIGYGSLGSFLCELLTEKRMCKK